MIDKINKKKQTVWTESFDFGWFKHLILPGEYVVMQHSNGSHNFDSHLNQEVVPSLFGYSQQIIHSNRISYVTRLKLGVIQSTK